MGPLKDSLRDTSEHNLFEPSGAVGADYDEIRFFFFSKADDGIDRITCQHRSADALILYLVVLHKIAHQFLCPGQKFFICCTK